MKTYILTKGASLSSLKVPVSRYHSTTGCKRALLCSSGIIRRSCQDTCRYILMADPSMNELKIALDVTLASSATYWKRCNLLVVGSFLGLFDE